MPKNHPPLTAERLRDLLSYDPETGELRRRINSGNAKAGDIAGGKDEEGYVRVRVNCRKYQSHRLVWLYVHGQWPKQQLDHINGIRDDNRIANLREATNAENAQNKIVGQNKAGFTGVRPQSRGKAWRAAISVNGEKVYLGSFSDPSDAYASAKEKFHTFHPEVTRRTP